MFVDSLIALCSTSHVQLKHVVNRGFEAVAGRLSKVGFSLLAQAVVREDSKYLQDDGETDGAGEGGDEEGQDEAGSEEEAADESEDGRESDEDGDLGKRRPKKNGHPDIVDHAGVAKPQKKSKMLER